MKKAIPIADCKVGYLYRVRARNFDLAVHVGGGIFTGIRQKFGKEFLENELSYEISALINSWRGSVTPTEELELWPAESDLFAYLKTAQEKFRLTSPDSLVG